MVYKKPVAQNTARISSSSMLGLKLKTPIAAPVKTPTVYSAPPPIDYNDQWIMEKFDEHSTEIQKIQEAIDDIEITFVENITNNITETIVQQAEFTGLATQGYVDSSIEGLVTVGFVATNIAAVDNRLDALESIVGTMSSDIRTLNAKIDNLYALLEQHAEMIAGMGEAITCNAGQYVSGGECLPCPANTFQHIHGFMGKSCAPCPANATCTATNFICNVGFLVVGGSACSAITCGAGQYLNGNTCAACPAGQIQSAPAHSSTSCTTCTGATGPNDAQTACITITDCTKTGFRLGSVGQTCGNLGPTSLPGAASNSNYSTISSTSSPCSCNGVACQNTSTNKLICRKFCEAGERLCTVKPFMH